MQIRFLQSEINRNEPCLLDDLLAVKPIQFVLSVLDFLQKNAALFVLPVLDCQPDKSCDRHDRRFDYGSESLWVYSFILSPPPQRYNISLWQGGFRTNMGLNKPKRSAFIMLNNTKEILTLKELQELLHIGKNTALRLVQSGEIDAFRVGNQWRVLRESVAKYIRRYGI